MLPRRGLLMKVINECQGQNRVMLTLAEASDCGFTTYVEAVLDNHPLNSPAIGRGLA